MLVKKWMREVAITVDAKDSMLDATRRMKEQDIRMLPVMRKNKLVGVVTDRDLKRAGASDATTLEMHELYYLLSKITVGEIMTRNPITVPFDYTVEEAAEIFLKNKISGAPVVNKEGDIVGTITQSDVFRLLISVTGVGSRGFQFAFQLEDRPLSINEVTDIIRRYGCRIVSIMSTIHQDTGYRHVYIRACDCDRQKIEEMKEELISKVNLLYMVDHGDKKKDLYKEYPRPPAEWFLG